MIALNSWRKKMQYRCKACKSVFIPGEGFDYYPGMRCPCGKRMFKAEYTLEEIMAKSIAKAVVSKEADRCIEADAKVVADRFMKKLKNKEFHKDSPYKSMEENKC